MAVSAIVLAAGEGTRMRSARPKPLHMICGRPMVMHVIHALDELDVERTVVVVGHGAERVTKKVQEQAPGVGARQLRRADACSAAPATRRWSGMTAFPGDDLDDDSTVVVLPGDTPLLRPETLDALVAAHVANGYAATLITSVARRPDRLRPRRPCRHRRRRRPRAAHRRAARRHRRGARRSTRSTRACTRSAATCSARRCATSSPTTPRASTTSPTSSASLAGMGHRIGCVRRAAEAETQGVNDRWQLALAERELRRRTNRAWLLNGVTMLDPRQTFIDVTVAARPRRHAVPGHDPAGRHGRSATAARSAPTPASSTAASAPAASSRTPSARDSEVGAGARGRAVRRTCRPAARCAAGARHRRLLHCTRRD